MYLIWEIAIGILAGFLAGKIMRGKGYGVLIDLLLGLVGSVVGGFVFGLLGLHALRPGGTTRDRHGRRGDAGVARSTTLIRVREIFMKRILSGLVIVIASAGIATAQGGKRPLSLDDLGKLKEVRDPQCAPDGKSVAFVVSQIDVKEDKPGSGHIWTVGIDGQNERQITSSTESESSPRFSPDGKYLSFTSSRPGKAKGNQVWLLDRSGGEAFQLTEIKGRLQGYEWSPDSKRLALTIGDPDPDAPEDQPRAARRPPRKAPKPIVIDRYKYKQDVQGYLLSGRHTYVYLFDIATEVARSPDEGQGRRVVAVVVARRRRASPS